MSVFPMRTRTGVGILRQWGKHDLEPLFRSRSLSLSLKKISKITQTASLNLDLLHVRYAFMFFHFLPSYPLLTRFDPFLGFV